MSILRTNQPNFFGNGGEPLKSGYIYIGEPSKSPKDFQLPVILQDSQGNQSTATQPLRTNNQGQIAYNGKAIIAIINQDYSMLIQDSSQTDITNGYIPIVSAIDDGAGADFSGTRYYSILLSGLKDLAVTPGDTVGNIGKLAVDDELGASWLVRSADGTPADDVNFIDFSNGLQGVRIRDFLQPQDNLDNLADYPTTRTNLDVYATGDTYSSTQVDGLLSLKQDNPDIVAGYRASNSVYTSNTTSSSIAFDLDAEIAQDVWGSIGPTGSGAGNIWTAMDGLPTNIEFVDLIVHINAESAGTGLVQLTVHGYRSSTTPAASLQNRLAGITAEAASGSDQNGLTQLVRVPVDENRAFRLQWKPSANVATSTISIYLAGFGL